MAEAAHPGAALFPRAAYRQTAAARARAPAGPRRGPWRRGSGAEAPRYPGRRRRRRRRHSPRETLPIARRAAAAPECYARGRSGSGLRKRTGALGLGIRFRNKLLWRFSGKKKVVAPSLTSRQTFSRRGGSAPVHSSLCDRAGKPPSDRPGAGWRPAGSQLSHWDRDQKKNTITGQATKVPEHPSSQPPNFCCFTNYKVVLCILPGLRKEPLMELIPLPTIQSTKTSLP